MEEQKLQEETPMKGETPTKEETPKKKVEKVTKEKHPGRVASGKRLAERNRLKKLEAKNKEYKEKILEESKEEPREVEEKIIEKAAVKNEYNIGYRTKNISLLLLVVFVGGGFYFRDKIIQKWKSGENSEKSLEKTKEVKSEPEKPDPFYME